MTRRDEFNVHLEGYLEEYEGSTPLPESARDAIRAALPSTRQAPSWWPARRTPSMNKFVTIGLGAAAVVVLALLLGTQLIGSPGGTGGPGDEPSPSPEASVADPTPEPSAASPIDIAGLPAGTRLEGGDYAFTHMPNVQIVFTATSNWERNFPNWVVWSIDDDKATMGASTIDNVAIDPCQPDLGFQDPAVGPTVDDLVTALGAVPGLTLSAPTEVTQDGYSGVRLDYVPPDEFDNCLDDMSEAVLMTVDGNESSETTIHAPSGSDVFSLFIFDIDGTRVVITAAFTERRADELYEMLNSFRFEQP